MNTFSYKLRSAFLLVFLFVWSILLLCKIFSCAVLRRPDLLQKSNLLAWREGTIPARRGRILDKNSAVLAKDNFRCDLVMEYYPQHPYREKRLLRKLRIMDRNFSIRPKDTIFPCVLKTGLDLQEIRYYRTLFLGNPEVRVQGYFERETLPGLEKILGTTAINDQKESVGISGLEKTHDLTLSGKSGHFVVMLNRRGQWVNETLRILSQPVNGRDIRLPQSTEELQQNHE
jgi:cell division protein FtsI/penicillin-binding protein 2